MTVRFLYSSRKDYFMLPFFCLFVFLSLQIIYFFLTSIVWKRAVGTFFKISSFEFHQYTVYTGLEQHESKMGVYINGLEFSDELSI